MKKCPRCKKQVDSHYQYCPHCGMNLSQRPRKNMLYILVLLLPLVYYFIIAGDYLLPTQNEKITLDEVSDTKATAILYQYESLEEYEQKINNTEKDIQIIKDYEKTINPNNKEYLISILNNNDINFKLLYSFDKNDYHVDIHKQYTKSGSLDYFEYAYTKEGISSLEDIQLDKELLNEYGEIAEFESLYQQLLLRKDDFNKKKDSIGHYGYGQYSDHASIVIYPNNDSFKVVFKSISMTQES